MSQVRSCCIEPIARARVHALRALLSFPAGAEQFGLLSCRMYMYRGAGMHGDSPAAVRHLTAAVQLSLCANLHALSLVSCLCPIPHASHMQHLQMHEFLALLLRCACFVAK